MNNFGHLGLSGYLNHSGHCPISLPSLAGTSPAITGEIMGSKLEARRYALEIIRPAGIRGCEYKARYTSQTRAEQEINRIRQSYLRNGVDPDKYRRPLRAYFCKQCSGFHLTSQKTYQRLKTKKNFRSTAYRA